MTKVDQVDDVEPTDPPADGRAARRDRNINAVLDVVIEMFTEGDFIPTIEQVSKRSGLSVRSIYRYFADPDELADAAIARHRQLAEPLGHLPSIGEGSLERRIDDFVTMRLRLHAGVGVAYRATVHNADRNQRLTKVLARNRNDLRAQFDQQFAPELDQLNDSERSAVLAAADVLTQLDAIDLLRRHHQLSTNATAEVLRVGLRKLLEIT